jgi:hypothetical protein
VGFHNAWRACCVTDSRCDCDAYSGGDTYTSSDRDAHSGPHIDPDFHSSPDLDPHAIAA